jgi:hypothetical protein
VIGTIIEVSGVVGLDESFWKLETIRMLEPERENTVPDAKSRMRLGRCFRVLT